MDFRSRSENNRMSEEEREIDVELDVSSEKFPYIFVQVGTLRREPASHLVSTI
jgi:hypothetical protein